LGHALRAIGMTDPKQIRNPEAEFLSLIGLGT
jgi:hypothetical protein